MAFNRGRRPRFVERLSSDPRFVRARTVVEGWAGEGADRYVRLGFVVFFLVLLVALLALFAGGSKRQPDGNRATRRAELTTPVATPSTAGGIPGLKPMIVRGSVLAGDSGAVPLQDPVVLAAVEGGSCGNYSVSTSGSAFTVTLPGGCAADGAGIHFEASGTGAGGTATSLQPVCVAGDGRSVAALPYEAGTSVEVQLRPGCAAESASLTFTPPRPLAPANGAGADVVDRLAPGFPGAINIDRLALALTDVPGFPGGLKIDSVLLAPEPPAAETAGATPPALARMLPGAIPTPPALAGVPPAGAVTTVRPATPAANTSAARASNPVIPSSPPIAPASSAPVTISAPPIAAAPPIVTAPPAIIPPIEEPTGAAGLQASPAPEATAAPAAATTPTAAAPPATPRPAAPSAMMLVVTVVGRQGAPVAPARVQAIAGQTICADETAAGFTASVQITLPGACTNLAAGSMLAFRAAGFDAAAGLIVTPAPACAVDSPATATSTPVSFQPGAIGQRVSLQLAAGQPLANCPSAAVESTNAMLLSVTVRTAGSDAPITSPLVRVFVAGTQCAEGASTGSTVAHVSLPASCGRPGDPLTFTAGDASSEPLAACSYELGFTAAGQPTPRYLPITYAPGPRSAALILASLAGCPNGAASGAVAADAMSLRLTVVDPQLPAAPVGRPTVTVFVGDAACARGSSVDTPEVVLTLPASCGQAGAALTFRVSSPDPRFTGGAETNACAIDSPAGGAAPRPGAPPITLQPGASASYALLPGDAACAATGPTTEPSPTATPVPAGTPAATAESPGSTPGAAGAAPSGTAAATPTPAPVRGPDNPIFSPLGNNPR